MQFFFYVCGPQLASDCYPCLHQYGHPYNYIPRTLSAMNCNSDLLLKEKEIDSVDPSDFELLKRILTYIHKMTTLKWCDYMFYSL